MNHRNNRIISWKKTSHNSLNSMTKKTFAEKLNHRIKRITRIISWKLSAIIRSIRWQKPFAENNESSNYTNYPNNTLKSPFVQFAQFDDKKPYLKTPSFNSLNSMTKTPSLRKVYHRITQINRIICWKTLRLIRSIRWPKKTSLSLSSNYTNYPNNTLKNPSFNSLNSMTKTPSLKTMNHRITRITRIIRWKTFRLIRSIRWQKLLRRKQWIIELHELPE